MEGSALEQFMILAKGTKGRAACALIQQAISSPTLYHFGELLEHANIAALSESPDTKPSLDLLRIFAYGTYNDYVAQESFLGQLHEHQIAKLRMLTIVSLAAEHRVIKYSSLLKGLGLSDTRTLEDLIIEGMYVGLFKGKLDQKKQEFQVSDTAGRDCKPGQLADMIATLQAWVQASENIAQQLTDKIEYAEQAQDSEASRVAAFATKIEDVRKTLQLVSQGDMDGPGGGQMESMDTDDVSRPKSRPKTKHPSGSLAGPRH